VTSVFNLFSQFKKCFFIRPDDIFQKIYTENPSDKILKKFFLEHDVFILDDFNGQ
jgi:hypothetical protein